MRGSGVTYDGDYYVKSVTHNLRPGSYQQNFTLSREGLIARSDTSARTDAPSRPAPGELRMAADRTTAFSASSAAGWSTTTTRCKLGRITAQVPDVLGDEPSTWALPCLPFTGPAGGSVRRAADGAGVWVEFEQGDPSFPIWTGCWYGDASELPPDARRGAARLASRWSIQTPGAHKLVMSDVPGGTGILLQAQGGAYIRIDEKGVTIGNGEGASIVLIGDEVNINEGQLIVPKKR